MDSRSANRAYIFLINRKLVIKTFTHTANDLKSTTKLINSNETKLPLGVSLHTGLL